MSADMPKLTTVEDEIDDDGALTQIDLRNESVSFKEVDKSQHKPNV